MAIKIGPKELALREQREQRSAQNKKSTKSAPGRSAEDARPGDKPAQTPVKEEKR